VTTSGLDCAQSASGDGSLLHSLCWTEAGDFFKDLRQLPILGKQGVDLGADTVGG